MTPFPKQTKQLRKRHRIEYAVGLGTSISEFMVSSAENADRQP